HRSLVFACILVQIPESMATGDLAAGSILLLQTVFGMLGNFSLLYCYLFLWCTGDRLRTVDLIVTNLIVANIFILFSAGFCSPMTTFGDFACRFFPYVRVVGRGVSIGTTFLLSVFQAITISPRTAKWAELKVKALKCMVPSVILCWTLNMLVNAIYPMYMSGTLRNRSITNRKDLGHCSAVSHGQPEDSLYAVLLSFPDALCFVLMILASGSTVFILYRHKQRVQNFRRTNISSISSPESRATKTILLLVFTFISFNILTFICTIIFAVFDSIDVFFVKTSAVIIACFPTVSPFLLMSRDSRISRNCFAGIRHSKSPTLICAKSLQ
uniref:Vomeronasal type-1 receptor n=1 Tax=Bos mutus grunniens TaxID=30521 RepID=A0A8B9Y1H2_BOSMU